MNAPAPLSERCAALFGGVLREVFKPRDPSTPRPYCARCARHFAALLRSIEPPPPPAKRRAALTPRPC